MRKRSVGLTVGVTVAAVAACQLGYITWRRRWQASPDECTRTLPGDHLVPEPQFNQTLAVTIDAPPSAIWPWLVQMGYGRAGWYSYDAIDMRGRSAQGIRPELQDLRVGQTVPLAPNMDFRAEIVEPDRALVLYGDSELVAQQQAARRAEAGEPEKEGAGLKLVGALSDANMSAFAVSWAFILEPIEGERTRLLERFRTTSTPGPATALVRPLIDVGHFLMTRRQMLGIRERAERMPAEVREAPPAPAEEPLELTVLV
jgi:hypothetical protein